MAKGIVISAQGETIPCKTPKLVSLWREEEPEVQMTERTMMAEANIRQMPNSGWIVNGEQTFQALQVVMQEWGGELPITESVVKAAGASRDGPFALEPPIHR